jgi:NitT/TauT family transport system substrate-binding protein
MPKVATGQADIGQADSTNTLLQQAEGLPVVQFGAVFQDDPSGLLVHAGGKMPRFLSTWDAGFRAYAVLVTSRKFAREHPGELRAFLRAYIRGWRDYLENDPTPAHEALKKANANNTDDFMMFSRKQIIDGRLVTGRDADGGPQNIGRLDPARFATQIAQLEDLGILKKDKVTAASAIATEFLPRE